MSSLSGSGSTKTSLLEGNLALSWRNKLQSIDSNNDDADDAVDGNNTASGGNENKIHLILASQSPRRREILDMMGLSKLYQVIPSPLDESILQKKLGQILPPVEYTKELALAKANALADEIVLKQQGQKQQVSSFSINQNNRPIIILGSDTIVDYNNHILEKPAGTDDAFRMLSMLSGQVHSVHTGVAIIAVHCKESSNSENVEMICTTLASWVDSARVEFADLSRADIDAYIATGEPLDKAGSYGIQGVGGQFVKRVEGDFFTVMGLPMHTTSIELSKAIQTLYKS